MKHQKAIKYTAGILLLLALGSIVLLLWKVIGTPMIRFVSDPAAVRQWVAANGVVSRLAFMGMVIFQVIVAVVPGEPFEIAAGYAFGAVEGTALCMLAAAIGSVAVFFLVRLWGMKLIGLFFSPEQLDAVKFLKTSPKRELLFALIYIIPGTPKDLLGYFAGMTDIRFFVFLFVSSLGRFPSVITSTVGGNAMGEKKYLFALLVFAATLVISLGGLLYRYICRKHEGGQAP